MSRGLRIRDYMATELVLLKPEMEILHAMRILLDRQISGAPVVDMNGALIGVLSKKDCLRAALHATYHQEWGSTVANHMTRQVETLDADLDLIGAVRRFLDSSYRRFPVVAEGRLVGQISRADLLRALVENWQ